MTVENDEKDIDTGEPIQELKDFAVLPAEELAGRVKGSINRRTLASDTVDFSVMVMLQSFWEFVRNVLEALPGANDKNEEDRDGR